MLGNAKNALILVLLGGPFFMGYPVQGKNGYSIPRGPLFMSPKTLTNAISNPSQVKAATIKSSMVLVFALEHTMIMKIYHLLIVYLCQDPLLTALKKFGISYKKCGEIEKNVPKEI